MRPIHEQEWEKAGERVWYMTGTVPCFVCDSESDEHARFISAAPDMARALLEVLQREPSSDLRFTLGAGLLDDMRAALRKAGVLP